MYCPLLASPDTYMADTVDLTRDQPAREYWLKCFKESLPKFTERAIASQAHANDVEVRAAKFREKFSTRLDLMGSQSCAFGNLTVRSILDMREHCLTEFDFHDVYLKQKQLENKQALGLLPAHLEYLAGLDWDQKQEQLAMGFLAGNVFDWGAKEVALLMEAGSMDFKAALRAIGPRPWERPVFDDVDRWVERMRGPPHRCVCIFIDNSGGDIILGVLPFVEEMLRRGTTVLLCANSRPILNDVTYAELSYILGQVIEI